jgi:hypothetical protein
MARYSYPHTIDNGGGERLTFLRRVQGPHGERLEVENTVAPGAGPPMHTIAIRPRRSPSSRDASATSASARRRSMPVPVRR